MATTLNVVLAVNRVAMATITEDDEGKSVVVEGEKVGIVSEVRGGTAYVDPDPSITESIKSKMGWGEADQETYPIREDSVSEVTDDEVRLTTRM